MDDRNAGPILGILLLLFAWWYKSQGAAGAGGGVVGSVIQSRVAGC